MNRLRELRLEKQLSSRKLAELIHMSFQNICSLENETVVLKEDNIRMFCEFYNVTSDYLLGYSDDRQGTRNIKDSIQDVVNDLQEMNEKELNDVKDYIKFIKSKR